jgi:hypothetical protein
MIVCMNAWLRTCSPATADLRAVRSAAQAWRSASACRRARSRPSRSSAALAWCTSRQCHSQLSHLGPEPSVLRCHHIAHTDRRLDISGFSTKAPAQSRVLRMSPAQPPAGALPATPPPPDPPARDPGESYDARLSVVIRMTCSYATGGPVALLGPWGGRCTPVYTLHAAARES